MQPDSELNKRVRPKAGGTPKCITPRTQKTASTQDNGTPNARTQPKTDIQKTKSTKDKVSLLKGTTEQYFTPERNTQHVVDSPATVFLKKIDRMSKSKELEKESVKNKQVNEIEVTNKTDTTLNNTPIEMDVSAQKKSPRKTNLRRLSMRHKPKNLFESQKNAISTVEEEEPTTPVANNANMSLSLKEAENETVLQTLPMEESINDLCATLSTTRIPAGGIVPFDSTRKPGHRRTMFEVSMDIISERLQNINRSSRRSVMPTDTFKQIESPTTFPKTDKVEQKETASVNSTTPTNNIVKKKRKLFVPNLSDSSLVFGTPPPLTSTEISRGLEADSPTMDSTLIKLTPRIEKKRRRTIMHSTPTVSSITKKAETKKKQLFNVEESPSGAKVGTKLAQRRRTLMPLTKSTLEDDKDKDKDKNEDVVKNIIVATKARTRSRRTIVSLTQSPLTEKKEEHNEKQHNNNVDNKSDNTTISCSAPPTLASVLPKSNTIENIKRAGLSRRSTLDFVDDKQNELATNKPKKIVKRATNTPKVMVFTNMHRPQAEAIRQVGDASLLTTTAGPNIAFGEIDSTI